MTGEEIKGIGEVIKVTNEWAKLLLAPTAKEFGLLLGDMVKAKREAMQLNREKIAGKIQTILIEQKVSTKELPTKTLIPILEGVSIEDDEFLQDMWANLFVNYIDSNKNLNVVVYPDLLKQLSSNEARFIMHLFKNNSSGINVKEEQAGLSFALNEINHLEAIGLVKEDVKYRTGDAGAVNWGGTSTYFLSKLGHDLLEACTRNIVN